MSNYSRNAHSLVVGDQLTDACGGGGSGAPIDEAADADVSLGLKSTKKVSRHASSPVSLGCAKLPSSVITRTGSSRSPPTPLYQFLPGRGPQRGGLNVAVSGKVESSPPKNANHVQ